jgi:hypothetical protein
MNGDLQNSLSSFNASSRQIEMEEGGGSDDGKETEYVDIMGMAAPDDDDYDDYQACDDYASMDGQSLGSLVVEISSRFKRRNSLDLEKSNYLVSDEDCEIASNDGTNYSGWSDDFDDEPDIPAPDFGRGLNRRQRRRHSLDKSYSSFEDEQGIGHAHGFGHRQKSRSSLDDSYRSFDIDHDSEQQYFPQDDTTKTISVQRLTCKASYTVKLAEEPTSMPPSRQAKTMDSQAGYARSLGAMPSSVGTYVIDMPDDFNTDTTPPVYTTRLRTSSTRAIQRRGTMDTARTAGTQGSDDFRTIPSGDEDSNETDNKAAFGGGVLMAVKFGMTLLRKIRQDDEEDEIADALESGKRNLHRARSTENLFVDISPKTAPPPSMLEYVVL